MNGIAILWRYKELIVIGLLLLSTFIFKSLWQSAKHDLEQYKLTAKIVYDNAVKENERVKAQSDKEIQSIITNHNKQLADLNLDRARESNKLKGSINEISDSLNIYRDAVSLRNESTNNNTLPKVSEASSGTSETIEHCHGQLATVIDACKVTDLDYKALYNAWDRACFIHGCE